MKKRQTILKQDEADIMNELMNLRDRSRDEVSHADDELDGSTIIADSLLSATDLAFAEPSPINTTSISHRSTTRRAAAAAPKNYLDHSIPRTEGVFNKWYTGLTGEESSATPEKRKRAED
jgi:hypothetical protein